VSAGTTMRIRTAHFPQAKTLEDFNLDHLPSLGRDVLAHLATAMFIPSPAQIKRSAQARFASPCARSTDRRVRRSAT
jgi:DNA replication protein DnaC